MSGAFREFGKRLFWSSAHLIPDKLRLKILFRDAHGFWPDLDNPRLFSEKIQWRKLHDRRDILTTFADKYRARDYVRSRVGPEVLTRIDWVSDDPETLPFEALPEKFVLKANHGTKWNILVSDKRKVRREDLVATLRTWLNDRYPPAHCEWGYANIRPLVFAEEYLSTANGGIPVDFKCFVFDGKVRLIQVDLDRFTDHSESFYDAEWQPVPILIGFPKGPEVMRPENLDALVRCAEQCGQGVDFVRVDLYNVDGRIVFGELTNYPGGGFSPISPRSFEEELGRWWTLPAI